MEIYPLIPEEEFQKECDSLDKRFDEILSRLEELKSNVSAFKNSSGFIEGGCTTTNEVSLYFSIL